MLDLSIFTQKIVDQKTALIRSLELNTTDKSVDKKIEGLAYASKRDDNHK